MVYSEQTLNKESLCFILWKLYLPALKIYFHLACIKHICFKLFLLFSPVPLVTSFTAMARSLFYVANHKYVQYMSDNSVYFYTWGFLWQLKLSMIQLNQSFSSKSEKTANPKTLRGKYLICLSEINKASMAGEQGELSGGLRGGLGLSPGSSVLPYSSCLVSEKVLLRVHQLF